MGVFLILFLSLAFFWIAWQDLKHRNVLVISFIICYLLTGIFLSLYQKPNWDNVLLNLAIVGFMVSFTGIYYILRYRLKFIERLKRSIGLGDIAMVPFLVLYFGPYGLLLFLVISFSLCLFYWVLAKKGQGKSLLVPLAGIQSLMLPVLLWYDFFNQHLITY